MTGESDGGPKRTSSAAEAMSTFGGNADMMRIFSHVCWLSDHVLPGLVQRACASQIECMTSSEEASRTVVACRFANSRIATRH
jgi:hypothetical protein